MNWSATWAGQFHLVTLSPSPPLDKLNGAQDKLRPK
jgi:hypothetical protein